MSVERALKIGMLNKGIRKQKELTDKTGLTETTLSNMATGKKVSYSSIEKVAKALNYTTAEFLALGE